MLQFVFKVNMTNQVVIECINESIRCFSSDKRSVALALRNRKAFIDVDSAGSRDK